MPSGADPGQGRGRPGPRPSLGRTELGPRPARLEAAGTGRTGRAPLGRAPG